MLLGQSVLVDSPPLLIIISLFFRWISLVSGLIDSIDLIFFRLVIFSNTWSALFVRSCFGDWHGLFGFIVLQVSLIVFVCVRNKKKKKEAFGDGRGEVERGDLKGIFGISV